MSVTNIINERTETEDRLGSELIQNGNFSELSSELVANGDFATDSDWTLGTDWSFGSNQVIGVNSITESSQQIFATSSSRVLKITYSVTVNSGQVAIFMSDQSKIWITTSGTYTDYVTSNSTTIEFDGRNSQPFNGSIDNVSVKQVDPNDRWTLGAGWSIVDGVASNDGSSSGLLTQTNVYPSSSIIYNNVFKARSVNGSSVDLRVYDGSGNNFEVITLTSSSFQEFTIKRLKAGINPHLYFYNINNAQIEVTNVSVKEVGADREAFTNETNQNGVSVINNVVNERTETEDRLGSELLTNGGFDTDSDWYKTNATISDGQAIVTVTGGGYSRINQAVSYTSGRKYRLIANIKGASGSSGKQVRFMDNSSDTGGLTTSNGVITLNESVQNVDVTWTANSNSSVLENARNTSSGDYSWAIYDISIKEVGVDREAFTNETDQNGTSTINNIVNERTVGLTFVETLLKAFKERVTYFENEECTKNDLNDLNNI